MALAVTATTDRTWTKILDGVTSGTLWLMSDKPFQYLVTYVAAGAAAPSDELKARQLEWPGAVVSNSSSIDVYVKSKAVDTSNAGSVLADGS